MNRQCWIVARPAWLLLLSHAAVLFVACASGSLPAKDGGAHMGAPDAGRPPGCQSDTDCDDHVTCTVDTCHVDGGTCDHTPNADACSDHDFCTGTETCNAAMGCMPGTAPDCSDMFSCTDDSCDSTMGACVHNAVHSRCDDAMVCNGAEQCDPATSTRADGCVAGTAISCDDGMVCTTDRCMEPGGTCDHLGSDADGDGYPAIGCNSGTDCNDLAAAIHPGAVEACDGVDNDCSGVIDDGAGMQCVLGSVAVACSTACGSAGTQACNSSCMYTTCLAAAEVCGNGCDDNGNGLTDEGCGPPNDHCAGATALSGSSGSLSDTLDGATVDVTDCFSGPELWYRLDVVGVRQVVYLDTFGSSFDTTISVRAGCTASAIECQDDACGTRQTQWAEALNPGTYFVAVHSYYSTVTTGTINLRWQMTRAGNGAYTRIYGNGTFTGTTAGSSGLSAVSCAGAGPEDGYIFTACPSTTLNITADTCTGTSFDTVLSLRAANDIEVTCNDDSCALQSSLSGSVTGAGVFVIMVDGYSSTALGAYSLNVGGLP